MTDKSDDPAPTFGELRGHAYRARRPAPSEPAPQSPSVPLDRYDLLARTVVDMARRKLRDDVGIEEIHTEAADVLRRADAQRATTLDAERTITDADIVTRGGGLLVVPESMFGGSVRGPLIDASRATAPAIGARPFWRAELGVETPCCRQTHALVQDSTEPQVVYVWTVECECGRRFLAQLDNGGARLVDAE